MKRILLWPNAERDKGFQFTKMAAKILTKSGMDVFLPDKFNCDEITKIDTGSAFENTDAVISLGGDGTLLICAPKAAANNIPILGINLGNTGFLAEIELSEIELLSRLAKEEFTLESRMMIEVEVRRGLNTVFMGIALNDAVISRGSLAQAVHLRLDIDGQNINVIKGDGVIAATPTGSTAYSMSAGGPIMEPTTKNIIITPICPHALYAHSFVLSADREVRVTPQSANERPTYLTLDGAPPTRLQDDECVIVRKSSHICRIVRFKRRSFYEIINEKLKRD